MDAVDTRALGTLRNAKPQLTRQQFLTLRGQILAGEPEGAMRGLQKILLFKSTNAIKRH